MLSKWARMPRSPSGSICQDRSIQNSFSSHTSPGFASWVRCTGLAGQLGVAALHRLAEPDPAPGVRFVGGDVVALGADAHRQHVVGEPGGLRPGRGQGDVAADEIGVGQHLDPGEPVGVGPHRVVDPGEVGVDAAPARLQEVREQEAHLVVGERVLDRPCQVVPSGLGRGVAGRDRDELVPAVGAGAAHGADRAGEHVEEEQAPRRLPPSEVAGAGGAPVVRGEAAEVGADDGGDLADGAGVDPADVGGVLGGVFGVVVEQGGTDLVEGTPVVPGGRP